MPIIDGSDDGGPLWDRDWDFEFGPYEKPKEVERPLEKRHHPLCNTRESIEYNCNCRSLYDKDYES